MNHAFDSEIYELLKGTYQVASFMNHPYSEDQLKIKIVATNLRALVNTFLLAADHPEKIEVNFKQVALGILGTIDFLEEGLPELEEPTIFPNP